MEWTKVEGYWNVYKTSKIFNGYHYSVFITVSNYIKTQKYWVAASSGKKRRELEIFEDKESKSLGGIKALLWIKEAMLDFPFFYKNPYNKREYICIEWSDSRRRDVYERLNKEGFNFAMTKGGKILMKKL